MECPTDPIEMARTALIVLDPPKTLTVRPSQDLEPAEDETSYDRFIRTRRSPGTRRLYATALARFADWRHMSGGMEAMADLCRGTVKRAGILLEDWQAALRDEGLAPGTINSYVRSICSFVNKGAYRNGEVSWKLQVDSEYDEKNRGNRDGPPERNIKKILALCAGPTEMEIRNRAIVQTAFILGLRRAEICSLDWTDVDLDQRIIQVLGKGRRVKKPLGFPRKVWATYNEFWLVRGRPTEGAVFVSLDPVRTGHRLTGGGIWTIINRLANRAGVPHVRPHGLRRSGADKIAKKTGGDVVALVEWGRWSGPDIALGYIAKAAERQARMAALIADEEYEEGA